MSRNTIFVILTVALLLGGGAAAGCYLLGEGIVTARISDRSVVVKGFAEKDVRADLATWSIRFRATGDALNYPSPLKLGHYFGMERGFVMAWKRHSDEDILKLLGEIEVNLSAGSRQQAAISNVQSACRGVGISDATYYNRRKRFGGMGRHQAHPDRSRITVGERIQRTLQRYPAS